MDPDPNQAKAIFLEAVEKYDPDAWPAFLDQACAGQAELRRRVEVLLQAHREAGTGAYQAGADEEVPPGEAPGAGESAGSVIGPYKLLQRIGEGGMGTVWMAEQTRPVQRKVALKIITPGMDSRQVLARFEAERQALALMDHPNIAKVFDGGATASGRPYFVMELVKGVPITRYCDEHRLTPPQRLELFLPVCQAIQHAHQKGIIHRDVKPSNVLVAPYDGRPVVKVIDFGIAKAAGQRLTERTLFTEFGAVVGTLEYMSPEQAELNNQDIDTRSDIYSLGVLLYELLTGTTPLDRARLKQAAFTEMLRIIREVEPPRPSTRLSESKDSLPSISAQRHTEPAKLTALVRGELDWLVMKALEKDRGRRYETANGFAMDVQRYLAGEAVLAVPPSAGYRLRKFVRKHRAVLTAAAVMVGLLVAGIVGTTIGLFRARAAEEAEARRADSEGQAKEKALHAAEAEKQAHALSQKRLAQIQKGNEILTSIFADLDMKAVKLGLEPLEAVLARRLVKAAEELEGEAVGDPLVVAALQARLGWSLVSLERGPAAVPLLVKARETRAAILGADHFDTVNTMAILATAYDGARRPELSLPLYKETLKIRKATLGPTHPLTLRTMNNLATWYKRAGKVNLALPLYEKVLQHRRFLLGANHPDTLSSMTNLAAAYTDAGRFDLSVPLNEETLKLRKAILGDDHPDTLFTMNHLAGAYHDAGKLDLALPLFEETLKRMKARLGLESPSTLTTMNNLAAVYRRAGKLDLALPLHEEALKLQKARLGADHANTLSTMSSLATSYEVAGKPELALPLYEETLRLQKAVLGADHPRTCTTMHNLAGLYLRTGKLREAIQLLEEARDGAEKNLGPDHRDTLAATASLGHGYLEAGKMPQALKLFQALLGPYEKKLGPYHPDTLKLLNNLAGAHAGVKQSEKAIALLQDLLKRCRMKLGREHPMTRDTTLNLARACFHANRPDEAIPLLEELHRSGRGVGGELVAAYMKAGKTGALADLVPVHLAAVRKQFQRDKAQLAAELVNLGRALLVLKRFADAEALLREGLTLRETLSAQDRREGKAPRARPWQIAAAKSILGEALLGQKKYAEAEPLLRAGYGGLKQAERAMPWETGYHVRDALRRLVELYDATANKEEAARWRKELDALKAANP
jgi:serine/threonine protein kinase